jgi:hypothetical protein
MDESAAFQRELVSRRRFLGHASASTACLASLSQTYGQERSSQPRPKVAALFTVLRFRSHAYNILENFLGPYLFRGEMTDPGVDIVSFYADQSPDDGMEREVSQRFGIPIYRTIDEALCLGGRKLAVDSVLSIAEHGDYPYNERGQQMYPRKEFFDQSLGVMKRSGRFVPFFNDKHLSYRWDWAKEMYDAARTHGIPLLAGSSVPLAQRKPPLDLPPDCEITEAVSIHGGGLESYDFHGLEVLQSIVESRKGGESGISEIQVLTGEDLNRAMKEQRWSQDLVDAAMQAEQNMNARRQSRPTTGVFKKSPEKPAELKHKLPARPNGPHAVVVTYKDGLKATVLKVGGSGDRWNFACRLRGEQKPRATAFFNSPWGNRGLFKALSHSIQHLFKHGEEPYPAERTLLTTGAVEAAMRSYEQGNARIKTPHLAINYQPVDWAAMRETGATWKKITVDVPQPAAFAPRPFSDLR